MQSISQSELKIFFNIQGTCLIFAMLLLLFTENQFFEVEEPLLTGSLPLILTVILGITAITQLFINLRSSSKILKLGIVGYALLTSMLLILLIAG